jgi:methylated-DNA-protein-cysteine methyltransferase-like protein
MSPFTERVIEVIQSIPKGHVATYGQIAELSGHPRAPRQVAGILSRYSDQFNLPWHRVISSKGVVSIKDSNGRAEQISRLREEGIHVDQADSVDLAEFGWRPIIEK